MNRVKNNSKPQPKLTQITIKVTLNKRQQEKLTQNRTEKEKPKEDYRKHIHWERDMANNFKEVCKKHVH